MAELGASYRPQWKNLKRSFGQMKTLDSDGDVVVLAVFG